jgi:hypothetical protein
MSVGITLEDILKVSVDIGGQVELFPDEASRKEVFFSTEGSPHISFFKRIFDDCRVVAGIKHIPVSSFVTSVLSHGDSRNIIINHIKGPNYF